MGTKHFTTVGTTARHQTYRLILIKTRSLNNNPKRHNSANSNESQR